MIGEITIKPLDWDWIGNTHAFGKGGGHSYEILFVIASPHHPNSNPPVGNPWRGKHLGYEGGDFVGYEWFPTKEDAMRAREEEHHAIMKSALKVEPISAQEAAKVVLSHVNEWLVPNVETYHPDCYQGSAYMEPDRDGMWVPYDDVTSALRDLSGEEQ